MKRYIRSQSIEPLEINIDVFVESPFINPEELNQYIAAAYNADDFNIPEGPVISRDKNRITQQMISDYESFIDDVETLCEVNYGLILTYENESEDHSHYYTYLVKDDNGNIVARVRFRLRVSNHPAHRTERQKQNKKAEVESPKLKELLTDEQIRKMRSYSKEVVVNDSTFDSYHAAFDHVDKLIEHAIDVVKNKRV